MGINISKKKLYIIAAILILLGLVFAGLFFRQQIKKGKFLPQVEHQLFYPEGQEFTFDRAFYCLGFEPNTKYNRIIIDKEADYQQLKKDIENGCKDFVYPEIDFNTKMVIGTYTTESCGAYFERDVRRDDKNKLIRYIIDVKSRFCQSGPGGRSLNLITIPKAPDDYHIQFEIYSKPSGIVKFEGFVDEPNEEVEKLLKERGIEMRTE